MSKYLVEFNFDGTRRSVLIPENRGIADVTEGFWLDGDFKWCLACNSRYWIPPSQLLYIKKLYGDER